MNILTFSRVQKHSSEGNKVPAGIRLAICDLELYHVTVTSFFSLANMNCPFNGISQLSLKASFVQYKLLAEWYPRHDIKDNFIFIAENKRDAPVCYTPLQ
jgi:hypothetical protein